MSIEIIEDNEHISNDLFLPPTVAAVKQSAGSKFTISIWATLLCFCVLMSAGDLAAFTLLLPVGILISAAHFISLKKSKNTYGSYGLTLLSASYFVSAILCIAFGIVWNLELTQPYIVKWLDFLTESIPQLPEPFNEIAAFRTVKGDIMCWAASVVFLAMCVVFNSLKTASDKNRPCGLIPIVSSSICFAIAGFLGYNGGKIIYSVFFDELYSSVELKIKMTRMATATIVLLFAAFAVLAGIYCLKIFIKMKKVKNVIQK